MTMISKFSTLLLLITALLWGVLANPQTTFAEEGKSAARTSIKEGAVDSNILEKSLDKIKEQSSNIELLKKRRDASEGLPRQIFERRLEKTTLEWLAQGVDYATKVAGQQKNTIDSSRHRDQARNILGEQFQIGNSAIDELRSREKMPGSDLTSTQLASAYIDLFDAQDFVNRAYELLVENIKISRKFEIDISQEEASLKRDIEDVAVSRSVLLEIELQNVSTLRESASVSPNDKDLKTKLTVATKHLKQIANKFTPILALMDGLAIDTTDYREQVLNSTGTITADVAEIGVVKDLLVGWGKTLWEALIADGPDLLFKVLLFLIILYVSNKLSKILKKIVEKGIERSRLHHSELLRRMVVSLVRNIILIIGFLIGLSQIGISLGPLLAGFGIIGFVIGFALQDSLSNFAAGLMILIYKPYDVGDLIDSGGMTGRVSHMSLVNTAIITFDNQTIIVPNNKIWGDVIKNVTAQTTRRIDMVFGISYSDDIEKAERILKQILDSNDKILHDPQPVIKLHELGESSVNFIVRPWVNKEDYWDVYWDVTRTVKVSFDKEGLSIPFPQRDVHLYPHTLQDELNG